MALLLLPERRGCSRESLFKRGDLGKLGLCCLLTASSSIFGRAQLCESKLEHCLAEQLTACLN